MTGPRLRRAALLAVMIILFALAIEAWFPPRVAMAIRLANGFVITTLLIAYIRRNLEYDTKLEAHRADILRIVDQDAEFRRANITLLFEQTAALDNKLKTIQATSRFAVKAATEQGQAITDKLDQMLKPKTKTRTKRR